MKRVILLFACVLMVYNTDAQPGTEKNIFLSGGLTFRSSSPTQMQRDGGVTTTIDLPSTSSFGMHAIGGFFVMPNLGVGMGLGFDRDKVTERNRGGWDEINEIMSVFTLAPTSRFYLPTTDNLSVFGEFGIALGFGVRRDVFKDGTVTVTDEFSVREFGVGITPGFNYMLASNIGLEMRYGFLGYESQTITLDNGDFEQTVPVVGLDFDLRRLMFSVSFFL